MKAIYVNWSAPYFNRDRLRGHGFKIFKESSVEYFKPDYEILFTILSVAYWKKFNGTTKLYTDKVGFEYYKSIGLLELWDEIDIDKLEKFNELQIDPAVFWTSAKTYCIATEEAPFVFSDLDFIIRQEMPAYFYNANVAIPHWEIPRGYYYPTREEMQKYWQPFDGFAQHMLMPNTSLLYINDTTLQETYLNMHMQLVNSFDTSDLTKTPEWVWLLADQGLFGQAIRKINIKTETLTDKIFLAENEGWMPNAEGWADMFYYKMNADQSKEKTDWEHVWLAKVVYGFDPDFKKRECQRYYYEICQVFPQYKNLMIKLNLNVYEL